jgi:hypothetical protein
MLKPCVKFTGASKPLDTERNNMSSLVRRIQRQIYPSTTGNPARQKFYNGRGQRLGITSPKCKSLIARLAREKRNAERNEA